MLLRSLSLLLLVIAAPRLIMADDVAGSSEKKCDKCPAACSVEGKYEEKCEGKSESGCKSGKCEGKSACCATLAAAKEKLPKMTYLVGTQTVCCHESAKELAQKSNQKIQFVVAGKNYAQQPDAFAALVQETEQFVNTFVTPCKCEASGKTTIAGQAIGCCNAAAKQSELVSTAVNKVRMGYKVGDEVVCCAKHAAKLSKEKNSAVVYVVDDESTQCELTARLKIATAKYLAAVNAASSADVSDTASTLSDTAKSDS